jgi:predicted O-methyltransferase YrrM
VVVAILDPAVARYLETVAPPIDPLLVEMEEFARRERIPIVHRPTGALLALLCRFRDPRVLEVGTAIGYSTVHMARALRSGRIVTIERDPQRAHQARAFLDRSGAGDKVEIVSGDALEVLGQLAGSFDLLFLDATKVEYGRYLELATPLLAEDALVVADNALADGSVAWPDERESGWDPEQRRALRELTRTLVDSPAWQGVVVPIGDGVVVAARRK